MKHAGAHISVKGVSGQPIEYAPGGHFLKQSSMKPKNRLILALNILFLGTSAGTTVLLVILPAYLLLAPLSRDLYYKVLRVYVGAPAFNGSSAHIRGDTSGRVPQSGRPHARFTLQEPSGTPQSASARG